MTHRRIIIEQSVLPSGDAQVQHADHGAMKAVVTYDPPDTATDKQIGDQVERITKRLTKLADD